MAELGYHYADSYDVGGSSHDIWVKPEDREAFIQKYLEEERKRLEECLREEEVDWYR
jgi:hypothetical protein